MAERLKLDAGTTERDHRDQGISGVKAKGAMAEHPNLAVVPFDDCIGQAQLDEAANPLPAIPEGLGQATDRLDLAFARPAIPLSEGPIGLLEVHGVKDLLKGFLEQVRAIEAHIVTWQLGELFSFA